MFLRPIPDILKYEDTGKYLSAMCEYYDYSHRDFSNLLGYKSPRVLNSIINKKLRLSEEKCRIIKKAFKLKHNEMVILYTMSYSNTSKGALDKEVFTYTRNCYRYKCGLDRSAASLRETRRRLDEKEKLKNPDNCVVCNELAEEDNDPSVRGINNLKEWFYGSNSEKVHLTCLEEYKKNEKS